MGALALRAMLESRRTRCRAPLSFLAAIEEECTGNGTLAAAAAGVTADAVVLLEPTNLDLLLGGVGILWLQIEVLGRAAHAEAAGRARERDRGGAADHRCDAGAGGGAEHDRRPAHPGRPAVQRQHRAGPRRRLAVERAQPHAPGRAHRLSAWLDAGAGRGPRPCAHQPGDAPPTRGSRGTRRRITAIGFRAAGLRPAGDHPLARHDGRGPRRRPRHGPGARSCCRPRRTRASTSTRSTSRRSATGRAPTASMRWTSASSSASIVAGARTLARFLLAWSAQTALPITFTADLHG